MNQQEVLALVALTALLDKRAKEVCEILNIYPTAIVYPASPNEDSLFITYEVEPHGWSGSPYQKTIPMRYPWMKKTEILKEEKEKRQQEQDSWHRFPFKKPV